MSDDNKLTATIIGDADQGTQIFIGKLTMEGLPHDGEGVLCKSTFGEITATPAGVGTMLGGLLKQFVQGAPAESRARFMAIAVVHFLVVAESEGSVTNVRRN